MATSCGPSAACERSSIRDGVNVVIVIGSVGLLWDDRFTRDLEDGAHHLLSRLGGPLLLLLVPWPGEPGTYRTRPSF